MSTQNQFYYMKARFIALCLMIGAINTFGQTTYTGYEITSEEINDVYIGPKEPFGSPNSGCPVDIQVTFEPNFPAQFKAAVNAAVQVLESEFASNIPIPIQFGWSESNFSAENNLAPAMYTQVTFDPPTTADPQLLPGVIYPADLASCRKNTPSNFGPPHVKIALNSKLGATAFYGGLDGQAKGKYDVVTLVLKQMLRALGMRSSVELYHGDYPAYAIDGFPFIGDVFLVNSSGKRLTSFPHSGPGLNSYLTSNDIFFDGVNAVNASSNGPVKIYAPTTFDRQSLSFLDENTYIPSVTADGLMTPILKKGEVIHKLGPITRGMLMDLGWRFTSSVPMEPEFQITNIASPVRLRNNVYSAPYGCDKAKIQFHPANEEYFRIRYKSTLESNFKTITVPFGHLTYTVSGLNSFFDYEFYVDAVNCIGSTTTLKIREACIKVVDQPAIVPLVIPNPSFLDDISITTADRKEKITYIEFYSLTNTSIGKQIPVGNPSESVKVSIKELPAGNYSGLVEFQNGMVQSIKFYKP